MSKKLTSTNRQRRTLHVPRPAARQHQVPYEGWLECAKVLLIRKASAWSRSTAWRGASRSTRGGFYHHFKSTPPCSRRC